jgi:hypothetical protein
MTSEAVRSTASAACLIARMTSGSMVVRNCRLSPGGGIRPLLGDGLSSAIALPLRSAIVGTLPWVAIGGKAMDQSLVRFPDNLARIPLLTRRNPLFKTGILRKYRYRYIYVY